LGNEKKSHAPRDIIIGCSVDPAHVSKTAFSTILGTFRSQVMQMGDCNALSTFQRLMTAIFRNCIGHFVHVYMDNIFIFLCSIEEHKKHLGIVFYRLRKNHLFLSKKKVDLYSERMECLGHIIDNRGIHTDADKMQRVREWRTPRTYNNVQRFLGLIQYLAHYMPDVSTYTTPLAGCVRNNRPFEWTPLLDKCLQSIKALACKVPILRLVDPKNPDPIWVITDGSKSGIGAVYGQGPE
jgi:Reverse transcriptase (RNA-dependent DNA polymerase)